MTLNPFDLTGGAFLGFYAGVIACGVAAVLIVRRLVAASAGDARSDVELDPYETAALAGGGGRVALLALATLVDRGYARVNGGSLSYTGKSGTDRLHPVERKLLAEEPTTVGRARVRLKPTVEAIEATLAAQQLMVSRDAAQACRTTTWVAFLFTLAVGIAKVCVGWSRGRPIEFLVGMIVAAVFIFFALLKLRPPLTTLGSRALARLRAARPRDEAPNGRAPLADADVATMVALWGLPMLAAYPAYADLRRSFANGGDGSSSFDSSGGDSGGGGGDGGGCGGGGCGGCGGGD